MRNKERIIVKSFFVLVFLFSTFFFFNADEFIFAGGTALLFLGTVSNLTAVLVNGGMMPVYLGKVYKKYGRQTDKDRTHIFFRNKKYIKLYYLTDIFYLEVEGGDSDRMVSIGDYIIDFGYFGVVTGMMIVVIGALI